uniref:Retrovirus-related Pol polyprotein from transposon TNT 1-94 n=1 Tax=Cajanus cajan TaxID=3821 RepID=A0A151RPI5_CAJCA|nr:Retrovirus-related Pol polyprotein from transposon TNT 1-94 [Cajanus cajan]
MRDYVDGEEFSESKDAINMALIDCTDPESFEVAVKSSKWRQAMDAEINSIVKNGIWELTDLPAGAKKIGVKWIYKTKLNEIGQVDKYKARLVAKGYSQEQGVDYIEVFAPVSKMDIVRMIIAIAASRGWKLYQLDVKSAFLYGTLNEDVYVEQPKGYVQKGCENKVYKLYKALYGLKQAPRAWFNRIESYFMSAGFRKSNHEQTLFLKHTLDERVLIVSLYVDDLIYTSNDESLMSAFKNSMKKEFDMTDLGRMRFFLGIEVLQEDDGIYIYQRKYALEVLRRFGMSDSNFFKVPIVPGCKLSKDETGMKVDETRYKQLVGSLMYITATRLNLMFSVSLISRFMSQPTQIHMQVAKRVLRYLQGTVDFGIFYKKGGDEELLAYTNSDYAGELVDRKSTSGYVFLLSNGAVAWSSKK